MYKKGKQNVVADALSRKDEDVEALLCAISIIQPDWINEGRKEWKNDQEVWALIRKLQQDSSTSDTFSWKNYSLWYKDRLYLCKNSQLKQKILMELHTSPYLFRFIQLFVSLLLEPYLSFLCILFSPRLYVIWANQKQKGRIFLMCMLFSATP